MEKLLPLDYLELLKILTRVNTQDQLSKQLRLNVRRLLDALGTSPCFAELLAYLSDSNPRLVEFPAAPDLDSDDELSSLFVEWILALLEFYNVSLTKAMINHGRTSKYKSSPPSFSSSLSCPSSSPSTSPSSPSSTCSVSLLPGGSSDPPPDCLTPDQRWVVESAVDFAFVLGVCPQLVAGVSDALQSESRAYKLVLTSFRCLPNFRKCPGLLKRSVDVMVELFEAKPSLLFKEYILGAHFRCYLLAVFQLCHCPDTADKVWRSRDSDGTSREHQSLKQYLKTLIDQSPKKFIFRELTSLPAIESQGTDSKNPMWLTETSGLFIRDCIVREEGVKSFILSFVEEEPQNFVTSTQDNLLKPSSIDWVKCNLLSRIIRDCPLGDMAEELYCSFVLDQIQKLLEQFYYSEGTSGADFARPLSKSMVPILVNATASFWATHPLIFDKKILQRLAGPLYMCTKICLDSHKNGNSDAIVEVVSEKDFSICIDTLYEILIIFRIPSSKLAKCMLPLIGVLHDLYSYTSANPTYLSSSVESLFLETMLCLETDQAFSLFKFFSGLEDFDPVVFQRSQMIRFMSNELQFAPGISGGIRVVLKGERGNMGRSKKDGKRSQSLKARMTIGRNIIKMENMNMSREVALYCLQRLTNSMYPHDLHVDLWSDLSSHHLCLSILRELVRSHEDVFRLDCFQQIVVFSKVVLENTLKSLKESGKSKAHCADDETQQDSLDFVLRLLYSLINESDKFKASSTILNHLKDLVTPLKCLYLKHFDMEVKVMSIELVKVITSFAGVQSSGTGFEPSATVFSPPQKMRVAGDKTCHKTTSCSRSSCSIPVTKSLAPAQKSHLPRSNLTICLHSDSIAKDREVTPPTILANPSRSMSSGLRSGNLTPRSKTVRFSRVIMGAFEEELNKL